MILRLSVFGTPKIGKRDDGVVEGGRTWFSWRIRRKSCSFSRPVASSLSRSGEELRTQLGQLRAEAEAATSKAKTARLRLLRLSEAAEQLQRQAALHVRSGKEDDARELLFQKKKVMQALEKSKNRTELLDLLSGKLCEAISLKEEELISYVASQSSVTVKDDDDDTPIRIVSPKVEPEESTITEAYNCKIEDIQDGKSQNGQTRDVEEVYPEDVQSRESKMEDYSGQIQQSNVDLQGEITDVMTGQMSYKAYLEDVDNKFQQIENDLVGLIRFSYVVMESEQREENKKIKQISEILESIASIRKRLASTIMHGSSDTT